MAAAVSSSTSYPISILDQNPGPTVKSYISSAAAPRISRTHSPTSTSGGIGSSSTHRGAGSDGGGGSDGSSGGSGCAGSNGGSGSGSSTLGGSGGGCISALSTIAS
ncbi:MAG: hypothetical protein GEU81_17725 [Nitriliruptorales bacterium]|nr:hypothetical protein [Nitriliruptorales bacterium]